MPLRVKDGDKLVPRTIAMSGPMWETLAKLAEAHGRTISEEARHAVSVWAAQCGKPIDEVRPATAVTARGRHADWQVSE